MIASFMGTKQRKIRESCCMLRLLSRSDVCPSNARCLMACMEAVDAFDSMIFVTEKDVA